MRFALALLAMTGPLLAQDHDGPAGEPVNPLDPAAAERRQETAASLFYRAFWIEQAQREVEQAEKLYAELIERYAEAPEAPRAYVALIRLRAGRGADVADLVRRLEQAYPKQVKEIERARLLAARVGSRFDPQKNDDDSQVQIKLKEIYVNFFGNGPIRVEDRDFLSDIGAAGHPMLAEVLRSTTSSAVAMATQVLIGQRTPEATRVLVAALRDPTVLYRMTIISQLRSYGAFDPELMKTLRELWPQASRSMRRRIAETWAAGTAAISSREQCFGYLAVAVADEDGAVRKAAVDIPDGFAHATLPAGYVAAVLPHCLKGDEFVAIAYQWLPWQMAHEDLAPGILKALAQYDGTLTLAREGKDERIPASLADAFARMAIARFEAGKARDSSSAGTRAFAALAARNSAAAAGSLLDGALRLAEPLLAWACQQGMSGAESADADGDARVAGAGAIRRRAIEAAYADDAKLRQAAEAALQVVGLDPAELDVVVREAQARPERGLLRAALEVSYLRALGAERAARLFAVAHPQQLSYLINNGRSVWMNKEILAGLPEPDRSNNGEPFWAAMLAHAQSSQSFIGAMFELPRESGPLARLVAAWAIDAKECEALNWSLPGKVRAGNAYGDRLLGVREVRDAAAIAPLRDRLFSMAADQRKEIGELALRIARDEKGENALVAYRNALDSPWPEHVRDALGGLSQRGAAGAAILAGYLQRPDLPAEQRAYALQRFLASEARTELPYIRGRLDARCSGYEAWVMWSLGFQYEPDATVERALKEVDGDGDVDHRTAALDVLTRSADPRRIEVFRKALREGTATDRVHLVLRTVADQYLIELGPEVLLHLRNPDSGVRDTATKAIERLKFYAEAKKLFDKEGN